MTLTLAGLQIHNALLYFTVLAVLWSCWVRVDLSLLLWGLRVSFRDSGGSRVAEDKRPVVEHVVHSRLDLANIIQDLPWFSLVFLFSQGCGSRTEE